MMKMIPSAAIPIGNEEIVAILKRFIVSEDVGEREVSEFEKRFVNYLGVNNAFSFNTGRTALYVALKALKLEPRAEVIVPAYTCAIVFEVILRLGLKPVLVDVNPETYNIDPELVSRAVTSRTRAIVPIHLFGQPCEMDEVTEIAKKNSLYVVEDAAQALGAKYRGSKAGTIGDFGIFSLGTGKSITSGEGGVLVVNNEEFEENVRDSQTKLSMPDLTWNLTLVKNVLAMKTFAIRNLYGSIQWRLQRTWVKGAKEIVENCSALTQRGKRAQVHPTIKLARMPPISAALASAQLKKVDEFNRKRRKNAEQLSEFLSSMAEGIGLPRTTEYAEGTFTRYTVKILKKPCEALMYRLLKHGIETERPYSYLPCLLEVFQADCPNTSKLCKSTLALPNHPLVNTTDIHRIADALSSEPKTYPTDLRSP